MQLSTSDLKKNGSLLKWQELVKQLLGEIPQVPFYLFCSPQEEISMIQDWQTFCQKHPRVQIKAASFSEVLHILNQSQLLITLDTSIKHLACFSSVPIFEIPLGSSNPYETAALSEQSDLYFKPLACQPCRHSSKCQENHRCHHELSIPDLVSKIKLFRQSFLTSLNVEVDQKGLTHVERF